MPENGHSSVGGGATLGGLNLQVGSDAKQTLQGIDQGRRGEGSVGNANTTLFFHNI